MPRPTPRALHRWLGLALVAPFLLWTATGLLFLVKPGWRGAYETLDGFRPDAVDERAVLPLASVAGASGARRVELGETALGPVYRLTTGSAGTPVLLDARTAAVLSPLSAEAARAVAVDAASRAHARDRYGTPRGVRVADDTVDVVFAGGAVVTVGRRDLSLSQRGPDTDRIDLLYRVHYLQWTGVPAIDRPLAVIAIVATWVLAGLGVALLFSRRP